MTGATTFDPVWEEKYRRGHRQRYPWDIVVSFFFRNVPRDRPITEVRVLEVGFGAGSNLWFAAREGASVAGVEGSESAVIAARERFAAEGLSGDLRVGDFTEPLPFPDASFDLVIDRGALTCCSLSDGRRAVREVSRVLRAGGAFLFTPYGRDQIGSERGDQLGDGLVTNISAGHLQGIGQVCFYTREDVVAAFDCSWRIDTMEHAVFEDTLAGEVIRSEWRVVAVKVQ